MAVAVREAGISADGARAPRCCSAYATRGSPSVAEPAGLASALCGEPVRGRDAVSHGGLSRFVAVAAATVLLLAIVVAVVPLGPPQSPTELTCFTPTNAAQASPPPADDDPVLRQAGALAAEGRLALAERLYEQRLTTDSRAAEGLAYVDGRRDAAARVAASAERLTRADRGDEADTCFQQALILDPANEVARAALTPDERVLPARAADRWDAFRTRWLEPIGRVLVPALVVLAVLLVVARLLTPLTAPPDARAWPDWTRRMAWWAGLALLLTTVVRSIGLLGWPAPWLDGVAADFRAPVIAAALVAAAVIAWSARSAKRLETWRERMVGLGAPRGALGPGYVFLAALSVVVLAIFTRALEPLGLGIPDEVWPWLLTGALALLGLLLHAAGRGHALRLQVTVKKGDASDPVGTAYVLARLEDLGSAPPRGLKAPQQVDVQDLPSSALSSLPAGKVAAALTSVVNLVFPSVPWRASVAGGGEPDEVVVTLTRNGSVAETAIVNASRFRPKISAAAGDGDADVDPSDLLTAAAAVILTTLADRHPTLRVGLCGATRWQSVAAYVVATKPPETRGGRELRRELLATAVDVDPENALARLAYLRLLAEESRTVEDLRTDAERLTELAASIPALDSPEAPTHATLEQLGRLPLVWDDGWTAFRLRTWHALTATWLNLCVSVRPRSPGRVWYAEQAVHSLTELRWHAFRDYAERNVQDFALGFRGIAFELREALGAVVGSDEGLPDVQRDPVRPLGLYALYDRACVSAYCRRAEDALEELRLASGLTEVRTMARTDPWFSKLRRPDGDSGFWDVIGPPDPAFTDLPLFGEQGPRLRALGIRTATDLWLVTSCAGGTTQLAHSLGVPEVVVARWHALAELGAARRPGDEEISTRLLALLLRSGMHSVDVLKERVTEDGGRASRPLAATAASRPTPSAAAAPRLFRSLADAAAGEGVRPPSRTDVDRLIARTLA
ncbi:DUF4332 domain-containing protein [Geodermatophilus sp. CPCC 205506]|uniref:DUF4332 domain-containing protein n=1 Tax=Geodermatophilus sp. CPCC 205506 TaxID=2936596 RepID=UPI003EE98636